MKKTGKFKEVKIGWSWTLFLFLGLEIWLGIKGNEITAKNYLENGWVFTNPEDDSVKIAKGKWGIG